MIHIKPKLIPVKYGRYSYPKYIVPDIEEIAGHFDKEHISPRMKYSLHTEYSFGKRAYAGDFFGDHIVIKNASSKEIPLLWHSVEWVKEFSEFIMKLVTGNHPPEVIEIHPPFRDYCADIEDFIDRYQYFEEIIRKHYPLVTLAIENRTNSYYKETFRISKMEDFLILSNR